MTSSNEKFHQVQSTRTHSNDPCALLTSSNLSYIPHDQINMSNFDVSA